MIDWTKPVQTRDGLYKGTVYCTDAPGQWPVHLRLERIGSDPIECFAASRLANGRQFHGHEGDMDLINVPPPDEYVTVSVSRHSSGRTVVTSDMLARDGWTKVASARIRIGEFVEDKA